MPSDSRASPSAITSSAQQAIAADDQVHCLSNTLGMMRGNVYAVQYLQCCKGSIFYSLILPQPDQLTISKRVLHVQYRL
jgi:hypothetical protein